MTRRGREANFDRDAAKVAGEKTFEGPECFICGGTAYYTSSGACVACSRWRASKRYKENKNEISRRDAARYKMKKLQEKEAEL